VQVHTYNSSTKEAEDQEYKASLGYIWKLCLKKKKKKKERKRKKLDTGGSHL
jgi:hypothetical protein